MIFKDYYKILDLENNKVTAEQIKIAYREQAKKYHPDVNVGNRNAEERFKDINEAYRVLSEANSKRKYDRMWNNYVGKKKAKAEAGAQQGKTSIVGDFFNIFFGPIDSKKMEARTTTAKNGKVPKKGENIETEMNISINDAFYGLQKKISLRTVNGNMRSFDVKIPAGIQNKEKIRLIGQGKNGENGGRNGDLFIKINIQDDKDFKLVGYDLYKYLPITPWEAALGTKASFSTIDEEVNVIVPKGTQSGELIRIAGKGYKDGKGSRGDLVAEVKIMVPKDMSEKETKLFKDLSEVSHFEPRTMSMK
ncbi:MAG: DnaJ domain-containing protein [Clostridia bacterium]|nr:DnaJ domain-containing protein [Clostridia bacterium]